MAGRKIVINDDVVTFAFERVRSMTADISGAPNHENGQASLLGTQVDDNREEVRLTAWKE
jgi:hypothetical protein